MSESVEAVIQSKEPSKREPTQREQAAIGKAVAYCRGRLEPLAYAVKTAEGARLTVESPHSDVGGTIALQNATFGTASIAFAERLAGQVSSAVRGQGQAFPTAEAINAGVAAVAGIGPQTEQEAMLAVQMLGTHEMAVGMMERARHAADINQAERYGNLATKFLRTYTTQLETLAKIRRGGEQTVRVEHVHVYSGGQAIVGQVATGGQGLAGGISENGRQPHALTGQAAYALPNGSPLLCQDTGGAGMPVAGSERPEAMPDARRRDGKRGAKG